MLKRYILPNNIKKEFGKLTGILKEDLEKSAGKPCPTVPQIFVDQTHIGGFTEFEAYAKENLGLYQ